MDSMPLVRLAHWVLVLCVLVLLVATPVHLLFTQSYVHLQYASPTLPPSIRFDAEERGRISDAIMRYMRNDAMLEAMATLRTQEGDTALLPSETQHLVDVRMVIVAFFRAHAIALVLSLAATGYLLRMAPTRLPVALRHGVGITAGILLVVGLAAAIDFDVFFTLFHGIFFQAGTWTFFYEDTLIQLYPIEFWMRAVMHLLVLMGALAAALLAVAAWLDRRLPRWYA